MQQELSEVFMKIEIDDIAAKAAVYDYIMSNIMKKDFEETAAVAGDVLRIILETGEKK